MTKPTSTAIAIIPARGGSKRLPRKNIVGFLGQPIVAWTIEAARASNRFERIVVSTDNEEIGAVARQFGADVADRPAELADDHSGVVDVCLDLLEREEQAGRRYDIICCLYATAPLRTADDICAVMDLVDPGHSDFAMAVTAFDLPPYRALKQEDDGSLAPMWPDLVGRKSQDIPPLVVNNGSTYAATVAAFRQHRTFTGPGVPGHSMPRERSTDIDDQADLDRAIDLGRDLAVDGSAVSRKSERPVDMWRSDFGDAYTGRNEISEARLSERREMWREILGAAPGEPFENIIEVGANIGLNLRALRDLTGARLFALEPNALARDRLRTDSVVMDDAILEGDASAIPLADSTVDLAFTCGVLIHIPPDELLAACRELHRVSSRYLLSIEYFAPSPETIAYHGHQGLLFKRDFGAFWLDNFDDLELVNYGFFWKRATGQDNVTWWLFRKGT